MVQKASAPRLPDAGEATFLLLGQSQCDEVAKSLVPLVEDAYGSLASTNEWARAGDDPAQHARQLLLPR